MRLHHVAQQHFRRLSYRYVLLRHVTITTILLTLVWVYAVYWGERSLYQSHIDSCAWENWEEWPQEAAPHHLVLIADPQLVDPHTYPGRPWPLSSLTESYTDRYMARNFRLINADLDPDSIFFLGDLFDGGREWPPDRARQLRTSQRKQLEDQGILMSQEKSKWDTIKEAVSGSRDEDAVVDVADPRVFVPGEDGRWVKWGRQQWYKDLDRFAKIFYDPRNLYPKTRRAMLPTYKMDPDTVALQNGAKKGSWQQYAIAGSKSRTIVSSLPGNHDVGFGAGVQISVRNRFESHFGNSNRIDIIGNHTIVSVDAPSLSAHSQYLKSGFESEAAQYEQLKHLWQPTWDFIESVNTTAMKSVSEAMTQYYPREGGQGWYHEVIDLHDPEQLARSKRAAMPAESKIRLPVLLLTHVPLFRNRDADCGSMRERGHAIPVHFGYQYQNVITQSLSKDLVEKVSTAGDIAMVFSGDDHDYCDVVHRYNIPIPGTKSYFPNDDSLKARYQRIREITVKSFSWAMGVRKPGFLLVSLWNPIDADGQTIGTPLPTVQTHNCLLPDQLGIFINYGLLFLLTIPVFLIQAIVHVYRSNEKPPDFLLPPSSSPKLGLPRFQHKSNGSANGFASPHKLIPTGRHSRGSSISTSHHSATNSLDTTNLSVQRSYNSRARSVSPAFGATLHPNNGSFGTPQLTAPLIDRAGFFPQVKWIDPSDEESDEESNIGTDVVDGVEDSQAKWKWRQRTPGKVRMVMKEFGTGLVVVGMPAGLWYWFLISSG